MRITIERLTMSNFKGIKSLEIDFDQKETNIHGDNGTGKTTVFDSFLWLLFGKDSTDRKEFGIKTLDSIGVAIPMIEHEVIGSLRIWDSEDADLSRTVTLRRTLREKWTKPKGQSEAVFSGNETVYYVDSVPCTQKEYNEKVDSICKESLFKLLTNPAFFPGLNWSQQRQALFGLIPAITNDEIMAALPEKALKQGKFDQLLSVLQSDKNLEDFRKQIANDKRRLNDELILIPARIDEVKRGMPEPEDWPVIEASIKEVESFIDRKEKEKSSKLASVEYDGKQRIELSSRLNIVKQKISSIKFAAENSVNDAIRAAKRLEDERKQNVSDYNDLISRTTNIIRGHELEMETLQAKRQTLIGEWKGINNEAYTHVVPDVCDRCGQQLPEDFRQNTEEENRKQWNEGKKLRLDANTKKGKSVAAEIEEKQNQISEAQIRLGQLKADLSQANERVEKSQPVSQPTTESILAANKEYSDLLSEEKTLTDTIESMPPAAQVDTSSIEQEISFARTALDEKKQLLAKLGIIQRGNQRKDELEASQTRLSQEIAALEQMEYSVETFVRTKVRMLEERINALFSVVKWKMFDLQVNGQLSETCECAINGVPYSDLNNAARINAGIDIINTMSKSYGIIAPVFIDNREAVNDIIATKAQIINLYVTRDRSLRIQ